MPSSVAADPVVERVVSFVDVTESFLFHKEISWLAAEGISTGWDVGGGVREYRPLASIARDAMAAFLYRKAGSPAYEPPASSPFTDVAPGAAFYKEITWLASQGISTGWDVGGGKRAYRPLNPIARDAMAAFLFRFAKPVGFTAPAQTPFVDVATGAAFYREITWLASSGISTGWDVGGGKRQYRPLNGIARDAMAAFLYRYAADKVSTNPLDPRAGTVTVAPDVEVLDIAQLDTALVSASSLTLPSSEAADINPNDVLVAGVTPGTPEGLLARVVEVGREPGGNTLVKLKPATLTEAIVSTSGLLEVTGTPVSSSFTPEPDVTVTTGQPAAAGRSSNLTRPQAVASGEVFSESFSIKRTIKSEVTNDELSGNGSVTLESSVRTSAKAKMTLEAGFLQLKEASIVLTPSFASKHSVSVSGSLEGTVSAKLGVLKAVIVFPTAIPVVVTAEAEVAANLNAAGTAEISYVTAHSVSYDVGFKYREGSFNLVNTKPQVTGVQNGVQATASLTARLSLDFDADIRFYGIAGITFGAGPYASAPIAVVASGGSLTWSCPLEIGFEARLGVVAGVEVMGFKFERTDGISASWKLLEANPCEGTAVVAPSPPDSPVITTKQLPPGTIGQAYRTVLTAAGGASPYSWSVSSGVLPDGLQLDSASGVVSGVPFGATTSAFTVTVRDARNASSSLAMSISILPLDASPSGLTGVLKTVTWGDAAFALKNDGTVWAWGMNPDGLLGTGDTVSPTKPLPTQVANLSGVEDIYIPSNYSGAAFARKSDGTLWAWGAHQWGLGNGTTYSSTPVQVTGVSSVKDFEGNGSNFFVVNGDGTVSGWGRNIYNVLGGAPQTALPAPVPGLSNIKQVSSDGLSAFAVDTDGKVFSWGIDSREVLGNGELGNYTVPTVVQGLPKVQKVVFDKYGGAVYALGLDGSLWTWGTKVGSMLGSYNKSPVQVSGIQNVKLVVSAYATYAITRDGALWSWGANSQGQLGHGNYTSISEPKQVLGLPAVSTLTTDTEHVVAVMGNGQMYWWGNRQQSSSRNNFGQTTPVAISAPTNVASVTNAFSNYGVTHPAVYATGIDGRLWAWGDNRSSELGNGSTDPSPIPLQVGLVP